MHGLFRKAAIIRMIQLKQCFQPSIKLKSFHVIKQENDILQLIKPNVFMQSFQKRWIMSLLEYDNVINDTLEDLADHFDCLADEGHFDNNFDCTLADGVLTANLGVHGTYVINKQTPNRQLWLSSPISGPKRYDFEDSTWVYSHEAGRNLHQLLTEEISELLQMKIDFTKLTHGASNT